MPMSAAATMKAVWIAQPGGVEQLEIREVPIPQTAPGFVRVRVVAAGLNRADLLQRRGVYPAPPGEPAQIPGLEFSGEIDEVGPGCGAYSVGDRVMAVVGGGAMAQWIVVHHRLLLPVPDAVDLTEAAAIPEVFTTAHDALFTQAGVGTGDTVVVHAVASGVGTAASQLLQAAGASCIGTSRTAAKLANLDRLGVHQSAWADPCHPKALWHELRSLVGSGAHAVLDLVGGAYTGASIELLRSGGTVVLVGLVGGVKSDVSLATLLTRRARLVGTILRSRELDEKAAAAEAMRRRVLPLFERRIVRPVIDDVLPMASIARAHERMEANDTVGKIVLRW